MAFSFSKMKSYNGPQTVEAASEAATNIATNNNSSLSPNKLTLSQLSKKPAKSQSPEWLKDSSSCLKQLPGIYHGVLGQVQLQPTLDLSDGKKFTSGLEKLVRRHQKTDYLNRLTDTERVHQLLSTSRLSNEHLATIWAHVNKTFPGQLTNREVCLALALIAIFQRLVGAGLLQKDGQKSSSDKDPFAMVKLEKKAPVPTLYSNDASQQRQNRPCRLLNSSSVPNDLDGLLLLIDITGDGEAGAVLKSTSHHQSACMFGNQPISLLDGDTQVGVDLAKLTGVWWKFMCAMKSLFKRSFDILNVEHGRSSALEALKSRDGIAYCKNLCLCYPIAHNIANKIDELKQFQRRERHNGADSKRQVELFDKSYAALINDLMISINEYWAVLINLFHESGQTHFIELIMDGLNRDNKTIVSDSLDELLLELDTTNKPDICSLCHTKFYLVNIGDALDMRVICKEDLDLVLINELLSQDEQADECHFYHAKCANFWLNNVPDNEDGQLPFRRLPARNDETILKPTSINTTTTTNNNNNNNNKTVGS